MFSGSLFLMYREPRGREYEGSSIPKRDDLLASQMFVCLLWTRDGIKTGENLKTTAGAKCAVQFFFKKINI